MPWPKGVHRPAPTKAKLTPEQVIEIRLRYATSSESYRKIAEVYGLHHDTVYKIINSYTWQHLPGTWDPELRTYFTAKEGRAP